MRCFFLQNAVDYNLEWGYDKSILYVYKWCVHLLQTGKLEETDVYDHEQFKADYPKLQMLEFYFLFYIHTVCMLLCDYIIIIGGSFK